jgi:hypothetical protein
VAVAFLLVDAPFVACFANGLVNRKPTSWYPSACSTRTARARMLREDWSWLLAAKNGAVGISSETCVDCGKERRTATKAPPAETFTAVANSRKSFPFSSRLRTKIGIANGSRGQRRRSCRFCSVKGSIPHQGSNGDTVASWGPNNPPDVQASGSTPAKNPGKPCKTCIKQGPSLRSGCWIVSRYSPVWSCLSGGYKCKLFPIFDKLMAFFVDSGEMNSIRFVSGYLSLWIGCPLPIVRPESGFP